GGPHGHPVGERPLLLGDRLVLDHPLLPRGERAEVPGHLRLGTGLAGRFGLRGRLAPRLVPDEAEARRQDVRHHHVGERGGAGVGHLDAEGHRVEEEHLGRTALPHAHAAVGRARGGGGGGAGGGAGGGGAGAGGTAGGPGGGAPGAAGWPTRVVTHWPYSNWTRAQLWTSPAPVGRSTRTISRQAHGGSVP